MAAFDTIAVLITLAAAFGYINHRWIKVPMTVGMMLISLAVSLAMLLLEQTGLPAAHWAEALLSGVDFSQVLLGGMLGLLLFAGALHVNLDDLAREKLVVAALATVGVLTSTFLVGTAMFGLSRLFGLGPRYIDWLLFGALISPTDPIAVLAILKKARAPKALETKIAGESLFNDGIGVVVFLVIAEIAAGGGQVSAGHVAVLFAEEVVGGLALGLLGGYLVYLLLKSINHYGVEIMITLALTTGGYALAGALHLSGPIAMVAAGLLIGNRGRRLAMTQVTRENLDTFWELVDEILNAVLFVLIGLEVLVLTFSPKTILAGVLAIPVVLASRLFSTGAPVAIMSWWRDFLPGTVAVLTWGGLRGGISVALALSLPSSPGREMILAATYAVVAFSILVQGLTIKPLVRKLRTKRA